MPDLMVLAAARDVAVEAALDAGRLIRFEAGRLDLAQVRSKGIHDLVTEIDERSQAIILEKILARFPDHSILAEESDQDTAGASPDWRWIIDPIDGTTNFTHGVPPYAVSIGLQYKARSVVGVVYDVSRDELFTAVAGQGAWMNGRRLRVSEADRLEDCLLTTGFPYRSFGHADTYLAVLKEFFQRAQGVRRPGSASVDLAWVAAGRFDGFFEIGLSPWDVAAGVLLVEEAGGRVSDFGAGLDPVTGGQVIASNGRIHESMASIVAPLRHMSA